jgi:hypothetical protein
MKNDEKPSIEKNDIAPSYIGLKIKARDTPGNREVHERFDEFSKHQTDHHHTAALRLLLETWENVKQFELLFDRVAALEAKVYEQEEKQEEQDEETRGTF